MSECRPVARVGPDRKRHAYSSLPRVLFDVEHQFYQLGKRQNGDTPECAAHQRTETNTNGGPTLRLIIGLKNGHDARNKCHHRRQNNYRRQAAIEQRDDAQRRIFSALATGRSVSFTRRCLKLYVGP